MINSEVFGKLMLVGAMVGLIILGVWMTYSLTDSYTEYNHLRRAIEDVADEDTQKQITQRVIELRNPEGSKSIFVGK